MRNELMIACGLVLAVAACKKDEAVKPAAAKPAAAPVAKEAVLVPVAPTEVPAPAAPVASTGACKGAEHKDPNFCIDLPAGYKLREGDTDPSMVAYVRDGQPTIGVHWFEAPSVEVQLGREGFSEWPAANKVEKVDLPGRGAMVTYVGEDDKLPHARVFVDGGKSPKYPDSILVLSCDARSESATDPKYDVMKAACLTLRGL